MTTDGRNDYEHDVYYEVWRSGGNPDDIDFDMVFDRFYEGLTVFEAAEIELRKRAKRMQSDECEFD